MRRLLIWLFCLTIPQVLIARITYNNIEGKRRVINDKGDLEPELEMPALPEDEDVVQFMALLTMTDEKYFAFTDFLVRHGFELSRDHFKFLEAAFNHLKDVQLHLQKVHMMLLDSLTRDTLIKVEYPVTAAKHGAINAKDISFQIVHNVTTCLTEATTLIRSSPKMIGKHDYIPTDEELDEKVEAERVRLEGKVDFDPVEYRKTIKTHYKVVRDNYLRRKRGEDMLKDCETGEGELNWLMLAHREVNKYFVWTDMVYEHTANDTMLAERPDMKKKMYKHIEDGSQQAIRALETLRFLIGKITHDVMMDAEEDESVEEIEGGDTKRIFKTYFDAHLAYVHQQRASMKEEFTELNEKEMAKAKKEDEEKKAALDEKIKKAQEQHHQDYYQKLPEDQRERRKNMHEAQIGEMMAEIEHVREQAREDEKKLKYLPGVENGPGMHSRHHDEL